MANPPQTSVQLSCGESPICKLNPSSCPNNDYVQLLLDVATVRGFPDLRRASNNDRHLLLEGRKIAPGAYFSRFLLSLLQNPAVLSDGTMIFVDLESYSIVLMTSSNEFIPFCRSYRCLRRAIIVENNAAFCNAECLSNKLDARQMFGCLWLFDELFRKNLDPTESNWNLLLKDIPVARKPSEGLSKCFGDITVKIGFKETQTVPPELCLAVSISGVKGYAYMCQHPYCGNVSFAPFMYCNQDE